MEKVEFIQFEVFTNGERVYQFGGAAADRAKLIRKARRIAKRIVADLTGYKKKYNMAIRDRVSIRAWRGTAILETLPNGRLLLTGSTVDGWDSNPINEEMRDLHEFFRCYCNDCVRSTANYDREFIF